MVRWTERASGDLIAIGEYITIDDPTAARRWLEAIRRRALKAARMPRTGRIVPEIGRDDVREVLHHTYRIVYRIVDDGIVVLTVFEGRRLLGALDPDRP